jgi:DNA-binding XRE family transcriptional regulator
MRRPFRFVNMTQQKGSTVPQIESQSFTETSRASPRTVRFADDARLAQESEFLSQLGNRLREMRTRHGMSRRELARQSGLSERYVAQIEAGKGNVSIVLLLRIALVFRQEQPAA